MSEPYGGSLRASSTTRTRITRQPVDANPLAIRRCHLPAAAGRHRRYGRLSRTSSQAVGPLESVEWNERTVRSNAAGTGSKPWLKSTDSSPITMPLGVTCPVPGSRRPTAGWPLCTSARNDGAGSFRQDHVDLDRCAPVTRQGIEHPHWGYRGGDPNREGSIVTGKHIDRPDVERRFDGIAGSAGDGVVGRVGRHADPGARPIGGCDSGRGR